MKKHVLAFLMAGLMCGTMLAGCGSDNASSGEAGDTGEGASSASGDTIKIGCSFDNLSDFMANVTDGAKAAGADNGVEVTVQDAEWDVSKQLQQVENFIAGGYDAVVIKPCDSEGCAPIAAACEEAGIPLVLVNTNASCDYDTYVGSDHVLSGKLQMEYVAEKLGGKGKIAILQGDLMNSATIERTDGNEEIVAQYPDMEVVSKQEASWMRDEAMTKMENWLSSGIEIDAVVANNDEMALGAAMVLKEAGIDDILVCGIDATVEALNALKDGTLSMTVFQNGYEQGYQGIVAALDILNGKTVEKFIEVPYETVLPEQADEYLEIVGG